MTIDLGGASRRGLIAGAGALGLVGSAGMTVLARGAAASSAEPHSLPDFHRPDETLAVAMSPDGARLAVLRQMRQGERDRAILDIVSTADPGGARTRVPIGEVEAQGLEWADPRHVLLVVTADNQIRGGRSLNWLIDGGGLTLTSRRVVSVDADSGRAVVMFGDDPRRLRRSLDLGYVIDTRADEPGHILMGVYDQTGFLGLYKVSISTGAGRLVERGARNTYDWKAVDGVAVLRRDISGRGDVESWYARAPGEDGWSFVRRNRILETPEFAWAGPSDRPGAVRVLARAEGEDTVALRDMDLRTLAYGPPIRARPGRDAAAEVLDARRRSVATAFQAARLDYDFADASLAPHFRAMNRFLDDEASVELTDVSTDHDRLLAYVHGPREPGAWYFYDRAGRSFTNIAARTGLDGARMASVRRLDVPTRDGAVIEAYLTPPPGEAPGPIVALIHGGPELRDVWTFDRQAQALASQGFWIVQPNFRGSGGYGEAFEALGHERWGERIQEDIEDAVRHAAGAASLDLSRVAIMGASFGGYSALISPILRPDLYRAAISICGISDLLELLADERREDTTPDNALYARFVRRIGDPSADAARLAIQSPRRRAAETPGPVLMVHGVDDRIAPISHSRAMKTALERAGKPVELIEVEDAGHGDWDDDKELELMTRYVGFLKSALA